MQDINSDSNFFSDLDISTIQKFLPYIKSRAAKYNMPGIETDDLIQEGLIALFRAVSSYSEKQDASFKTYAVRCIDNGIYSALKSCLSKKNLPLKDYVSLDLNDADMVSSDYVENITDARAELERVFERMSNDLSKLERKVLSLFVCGYSYKEIASMFNYSDKSVENAIVRARKKLRF